MRHANQPDDRLALTPTQQELYKVLADQHVGIAVCYQAAIAIINDEVLPDRLALAAHALRELMEKLPNEAGAIDMGADLSTKINELRNHGGGSGRGCRAWW